MKYFAICFCLCLCLAWAGGGSAWPQFQANCQHDGRTSIVLPNSLTVAWTKNLGTSISSYASPIIGWANMEETVIIGTAVGLYCLSSSNGETIWFYPTTSPVIYAPAYQVDGIWFAVNDTLYRLNPSTGQKIASYGLGGPIQGHLTLTENRLYFNAADCLWCFNLDGQFLWKTADLGPGFDNSAPSVDEEGDIYVVTLGNPGHWYDYRLYKFDSTGQEVWPMKEEFWGEPQGVRMTPTIAPNGDVIFATIFASFWTSSLYCYKPNGDLRWRKTDDGGIAYSSPAVAENGTIYHGVCNAGHFLRARDTLGNINWSYQSLVKYSSPAIDGSGKIVVGATNGRLIVLNSDGALFYEYNCAGSILTSPAIAWNQWQGAIYIATDGGKMYKFVSDDVAVKEQKNQSIKGIKCFPNPFKEILNISVDKEQTVKVYDINGREVFSENGKEIVWQSGNLPSGVYFVQIGGSQRIKVVKLK